MRQAAIGKPGSGLPFPDEHTSTQPDLATEWEAGGNRTQLSDLPV